MISDSTGSTFKKDAEIFPMEQSTYEKKKARDASKSFGEIKSHS